MKQKRTLYPVSTAFLALTACLSQNDIGSKPTSSPGCEAGTRFGENGVKCGETAADIDLSVGIPSQQAILRGEVAPLTVTRFGTTQLIPIQIENLGQTAATDFELQLLGDSSIHEVLTLASTDESSEIPSPHCREQVGPQERCTLVLKFSPQGQPYHAQRWSSSLVVDYNDGRSRQQLRYPLFLDGDHCSRQNRGFEFERESAREVGRIESDRITLTQSFIREDLESSDSEISHFWIPLKLSKTQTSFERLILSIHLSDSASGSAPQRGALIESELSFADFKTSEAAVAVQTQVALNYETELAGFHWVRFQLPSPLQINGIRPYHWSLRTVGLKDGALLFGKVDDFENRGHGYPGGNAGIWTTPIGGNPKYTSQPYRDVEFKIDQCLAP